MAGKDGSRRSADPAPAPADESDYYFVVAEGPPKRADELFDAWLSECGLARGDLPRGKLRVRGGARDDTRQYLVHYDVLKDCPGGLGDTRPG